MQTDPKIAALEDVLLEMSERSAVPNAEVLREFTAKYPQFASELVDFATASVEMDLFPEANSATAEDISEVVNRTMSRVQRILDAGERPAHVIDLTQEIRAVGYEIAEFERVIGIDRSILDCLAKRLIKPFQIPGRLVVALAETLLRAADQIREFLRMPPLQAAAYSARGRPQVERADFAIIVQHSSLSDEEKAAWLAAAPDPFLKE